MNELKETGGAKIGWANATWPFAKLHVTDKTLTLNATILGKLVFTRSDIRSIEVYRKFGVFRKGIQLNHSVPNYSKTVIFWTSRDPRQLIDAIEKTGFLESNSRLNPIDEMDLKEDQKKGGFPLKISFAIAIIVLWNLLSCIDLKKSLTQGELQFGPGEGFVLSTGVMVIACLLLLFIRQFQRLALKEGKRMEDIRSFVYLLLFISLALFLSRVFLL
jgi:hypothetical protein